MELMVKPVVPDVASGLRRAAGPTGPRAGTDPTVSARSWVGSTMSSFIDMIEPVVLRLSAGKRLVAVQSPDGVDLAFHLVSGRRAIAMGNSAENRDSLIKAIKLTKMTSAELRLDPDRLATARFNIPVAGARYAGQIVESRLDRLTPWRPEAVTHGFALSDKPGPDGQLEVDFLATSREIVDACVGQLAQFGLAASALGSAGQPLAERLRIDLFGGRNDASNRARRKAIGNVSIAVLAISIITCGMTLNTLRQTGLRIVELDATLAKARNRLINASGSTAQRDRDLAFIATKQLADARFHLIDRLAAVLPDHTYIDQLDIDTGSVHLVGSSTDASSLIRLLEDDAAFRDVKFAAPVTRQEDGRDRFEITALHGAKPTDAQQ